MVTAIAHEDDLKIMFIGDASCGKDLPPTRLHVARIHDEETAADQL